MKKWEYFWFDNSPHRPVKVGDEEIEFSEYLRRLGEEGWELVNGSAITYSESTMFDRSGGVVKIPGGFNCYFFFKRPIED